MAPSGVKPGVIKDPAVAALFSHKDPESRYDDLREIGHGSFGAVYFAFDKETSSTVAIKKMAYSGKQAGEKWADILKEVAFLNKIKHPHIVEYKACFLKDQTCWLVMEYCIGSAADIVDVLRQGLPERRPPLFNMNAMSALYHIAQNDPPKLAPITNENQPEWSDWFKDFVNICLQKDAEQRPATGELLNHPFITRYDHKGVIQELINRTKAIVMELDNFQYKKMRKLMYLDEVENKDGEQNRGGGCEEVDDIATDSGMLSVEKGDSTSSKSGSMKSLTSFRSLQSSSGGNGTSTRLPIPASMKTENVEGENRTLIPVGNVSDGSDAYNTRPPSPISLVKLDRNFKDDMATLKKSKFSTLRSAKLISREQEEYNKENNMYEQMNGYKRLRQMHHKEMQQLEEKCAAEIEILRQRLDKELDQLVAGYAKERQRFKNAHQSEMDKKRKEVEEGEKKLRKQILTRQAHEMRCFSNSQLKEYRHNKELAKNSLKERGLSRSAYETAVKDVKAQLTRQRTNAETAFEAKLRAELETELVKYRRSQLLMMHSNEKRLDEELEEKCAAEIEILRQRLDKELDQLVAGYAKERQRFKNAHQSEMDKKRKEVEEGEKKLRKQILTRQAHEMRCFSNSQLKEYRHNKELAKNSLKERGLSRSAYETAVKDVKAQLTRQRTNAETAFEAKLRAELETELVKYRRSQLLMMHSNEKRLDEEDLNVLERQMDNRHAMLLRHHEATRDVEIAHLKETQTMRKRHQIIQHEAESTNQTEYTRRKTEDLRKRHANQSRQQPRELKLKEAQIRKQFRQAVKTQARQFKLYQTQLMQAAPKEEHKEIAMQLKEKQKHRIALLTSQYEYQIESMVQEKTGKLESWQEEEARILHERLAKELDELKEYQGKQRAQLENTIDKERTALDERIALRRAMLEQRFKEEREDMQKQRETRSRATAERHAAEERQLAGDAGGNTSHTTAL
nr:Serine threonine protein kinase-related domain containing protein [Haemonchus contortus]